MSTENTDQSSESPLRIDEGINNRINGLRAAANTLRAEVGQLEIVKHQKLRQFMEIEGQAQGLVRQEVERLGIPSEAKWQLRTDGVIEMAPATGPAAEVAPETSE